MGIWRQRIEGTWLKCTSEVKFKIMNLNTAAMSSDFVTAVSLKHASIDQAPLDSRSTIDFGTANSIPPANKRGVMYDGIGLNSELGPDSYSYIIDYYYGPSITSTKRFSANKNYQFKTHTVNFLNVENRSYLYQPSNFGQSLAVPAFAQPHPKLYNSELNCFKGALGIDPSWEDLHFFEPPYYTQYIKSPYTPTTMILYYYSAPKTDFDSGFFSYTNRLKKSTADVFVGGVTASYKVGTQSVYQASYAITGVELNEISWKIQGYSFVSYDNNPSVNDYVGIGITNSYSGGVVDQKTPNRKSLKYCVYGKGWYYDDLNNEYTWYHRIYQEAKLNKNNNPVGGETGFQESHEGYIENNYIAKYIPFQKFNLSFLYENIRTDGGIKVYLAPTLPNPKALQSSNYSGALLFPPEYYIINSNAYTDFIAQPSFFHTYGQEGINRGTLSLVSSSSQLSYGGLSQSNGNTFPFPNKTIVFAPVSARETYWSLGQSGYQQLTIRTILYDSARSTTIRDYPGEAISNNIFVDDPNTNLKDIKIKITLRHTYIGDMIINLRAPNGKIINLKAQGSGESFNDLRKITFTTSTDFPKMKGLNWWPGATNSGFIMDPMGLGTSGVSAYPLRSPWLPVPFNASTYNFNWSQLTILEGLTFQMDKVNGQGSSLRLYDGTAANRGDGWSNAIYGSSDTINFRSNVNELKHLLNDDGTFNGTYSLYIKDNVGQDSGILESWDIEFLYKKIYTPILSLTQSDPTNAVNKGAAKLQYLFGLEGNQYLFIVGDKLKSAIDFNSTLGGTTINPQDLKASLKNLKIDGGFHSSNNKLYSVNDKVYGVYNSATASGANQILALPQNNESTVSPTFSDFGEGGENTFELLNPIENVAYSTYVGTGDLNNPSTLSLSGVTGKIGNGKFISGVWENGAWNSGWRYDESLHEFYNIDQFFSYNRDKTWRFSIFGSKYSTSNFSIGDKVSIGNIVAININEERKLIKSYFTIVSKTIDSISVEFESDFPIRRIKIDSSIHRIYVTKNVWLTGAFLNGYFTGVWNNGLFKGFPYITEMFNSHWVDGIFNGGHFYSRKKSVDFNNTYLATYKTIKVGLVFNTPHRLTEDDPINITANFGSFGDTKVLSVVDDYRIIVDLDWNSSRDPNTYGAAIKGTVNTNISTGLIQNFDFSANNISIINSLQSMDSTRVFMYDSWVDVNFDTQRAVNIGKPQSTIDNTVSSYSYSDNNLYGYPTYDVLSSDVTFRDSFSNTIRKYKLGSKYRIYQDYIGDAGNFDEHFDVTGWATKTRLYPTNTPPFYAMKTFGTQLPSSTSFLNQGWVINKDSATSSAISFERTTEALNDEDVVAGKEIKITSVGKGGVLNIQPSYDVPNRTNTTIDRLRYTIITFDLLKALVPDNIFEDSSVKYTDTSKYQPLIHFNNLNYATRKVYNSGVGYSDKILDTTYFPVYKNINHLETTSKTKVEYFYNKRNLSMFFRGNGLNGENLSEFVVDNLKLYEVDMIPFFQYFNEGNINKSVSVPYQATAPLVSYVENDYSLVDNSIYGLDSFYIYQPSGEVNIQAESAAAAAEAAQLDPVVASGVNNAPPPPAPDPSWEATPWYVPESQPYDPNSGGMSWACLVENTSIEMFDGSFKMIQDVKSGDLLKSISVSGMPLDSDKWYSWSESELIYEPCESMVESNNSFEVAGTIRINDVLETSYSHNNMIKRDGQWIIRKTEELKIGDILIDSLSNEIVIDSLLKIESVSKVYNIELIGSKLYFANGVLTHNKESNNNYTIGGSSIGSANEASPWAIDATANNTQWGAGNEEPPTGPGHSSGGGW